MNIAIIGTGNLGTGLAHVFSKTRHAVIFGGRTIDKGGLAARQFTRDTGLDIRGTSVSDAARQSDVIILAVPYNSIRDVITEAGDLSGKVIVDATNPLTDDFMGLTLGFDTSAAEEIQRLAGDTPVVKAFNTVFAQIYSQGPRFGKTSAQVFIASDDANAKKVTSELVDEAGFTPVDAGGLKNARYLEPLAALNIQLGYGLGRGTQIAPVWIERHAA